MFSEKKVCVAITWKKAYILWMFLKTIDSSLTRVLEISDFRVSSQSLQHICLYRYDKDVSI